MGRKEQRNGGGDNPQITQITGLVGQPAGREIDCGGHHRDTTTRRHDDTTRNEQRMMARQYYENSQQRPRRNPEV